MSIRVLTTLFLLASVSAYASNEKFDAHKISNKIDAQRQKVSNIDKQQREVLAALYALQKKIEDFATKSGRKHNDLMSANAEVKRVAREIAELKSKIGGQKARLGRRLKALYQWNNLGSLRYIIASVKVGELEKNLKYLKDISSRDVEVINSFSKNLSKLQSRQKKLKVKVKQFIVKKRQYEELKNSLEAQQTAKSNVLKRFKKTKASALVNIEGLKKQANSMDIEISQQDLENLFNASFFENKGRMSAPVEGRATSKFGLYYNYDYHFRLNNKGVLFLPDNGSATVHSIYQGKVTHAGAVKGYGETIIINHGDNYFSVYANLKSMKVSVGESVERGENIGDLKIKLAKIEPVYFELRHFSEALNPEEWIGRSLIVKESQDTALKTTKEDTI